LRTWLDIEQIEPGARIADKITEGLTASDYYMLIISENSNVSNWVKRELSLAFELSSKKLLTIIPLLLDNAPVPFELKGLLYIDLRQSIPKGIEELVKFFRSQFTEISKLEPRVTMLKSYAHEARTRLLCEDNLRTLKLGDLRHLLTMKLSRQEIAVIWFDLFERRMDDEAPNGDVSMSCVELLDRAHRRDLLADLISKICRSYPYVGRQAGERSPPRSLPPLLPI
jgi:hypothetical protein